jgi:hypothetical protein
MKRWLGYFAVLILSAVACAPVFAQNDALVGTWKMDTAKSKYTGVPAPKELTRTVEASGDSYKYTYSGTAADGSSISYGFTVKFDDKDYPVTGRAPGGFDMIAIKRINAHDYTATQKKGEKAMGTAKVVISKDGKVTTITAKGTGEDGKAVSYTSVYEKQ